MKNETVVRFGQINSIEGYSYLLLLFVAMPLKYLFDMPLGVKIVGMAHGVLFMIFCYYLYKAYIENKIPFKESVVFFIASLVPFGTFFTKQKIKTYE